MTHADAQAEPASPRHGIVRGWVIVGLALTAWVVVAGLFSVLLSVAGTLLA